MRIDPGLRTVTYTRIHIHTETQAQAKSRVCLGRSMNTCTSTHHVTKPWPGTSIRVPTPQAFSAINSVLALSLGFTMPPHTHALAALPMFGLLVRYNKHCPACSSGTCLSAVETCSKIPEATTLFSMWYVCAHTNFCHGLQLEPHLSSSLDPLVTCCCPKNFLTKANHTPTRDRFTLLFLGFCPSAIFFALQYRGFFKMVSCSNSNP